MRKAGPAFLKGALLEVEAAFQERLRHASRMTTHTTSLGDATERAWIELLRAYLPARYQVAQAFAIDCEGRSTLQLDCLIYDAHFTPALFGNDRQLYVPAEAVYATFEVKQVVQGSFIQAAAEKAASLRRLRRTSAPVPWLSGVGPPKMPFRILAGLLAMKTMRKDGLDDDFYQRLDRWQGDNYVDMVLTAQSGFCDRFNADGSPTGATGKGALIRGLFRLLSALRERASVTAVEWDKYEDVLK
jgi:hypothetical protein